MDFNFIKNLKFVIESLLCACIQVFTVTILYAEELPKITCPNNLSYWTDCVGVRTDDILKYHGEFTDNTYHGQGRAEYIYSQWIYEGSWQYGLKHGFGNETINRNGKIISYSGNFKNNLWHGQGVYRTDQLTYRGNFKGGSKHGRAIVVYTDGTRYVGDYRVGVKSGVGKQTWPNGKEYNGQWKWGLKHGSGRFVDATGNQYEGDWYRGKRQGQGKAIYKNGAIYEGSWRADNWSGKGVLINNKGDKFKGNFSKNVLSGIVTAEYHDGSTYEGPMVNNKREGYAKYTYPNGDFEHVTFKNDERIGKSEFTYASGAFATFTYKSGKVDGKVVYKSSDGDIINMWFEKGEQVFCSDKPEACEDDEICTYATTFKNGNKVWRKTTDVHFKEAKIRGLDCDVKKISEPKNLTVLAQYGDFKIYSEFTNSAFFNGEIGQGDNLDLRRAMRNHDIEYIVLNSPGGLVFEGLTMAGTIHDNGLTTVIPKDALCASACSFMYFAGKERQALGKLGVHQFFSGAQGKLADISKVEDNTQYTTSEIIGFLNNFGTPAWVFEKMFAEKDMYFFNDDEKLELSSKSLKPVLMQKFNQFIGAAKQSNNPKPQAVRKKPEPLYETVKETVYLDPIEAEWSYDTFIVTARNKSKHEVIVPKIEFRFGDCETPGSSTIKQAQRKLNNLGFDVGKPDGRLGPKTAAGIRAFQKKKRLSVTSRLNDQTLKSLGIDPDADFMQGIIGLPLGGNIKAGATALIYFENFKLFTQNRRICYRIFSDVYVKKLKQ